MRVVVADRGTPSLSDVAQVTVTVEHNLNPPEFGHDRVLTRSIAETTAVGTKIVTLNATDADKTVSFLNVEPHGVFDYEITWQFLK